METRTKKSFFNAFSNFIIMMLKTILAFITRTVFIKYLGEEALGLNGLFSNILSMLSLAELGIGTAINFSLYKPLAEKDEKRISILMSFYRKVYRIVGIVELIIGIILIPALKYIIKDISSIDNCYLIYILYLINTSTSYFISYKETLINADQNGYKLTIINLLSLIILNVSQIIFLIITRNFLIYLIIQIVISFFQRIITNIYISKKYKSINFKSKEKLNDNDKKCITKNVKAMFFHKIGDYCINGTDNLIISTMINLSTVGIYSNYLMIINMLNGFVTNAFNGITASLGNLVAKENDEKKDEVFKKLYFISFLLYGFCSVCLINVLTTFMTLWIGEKYCLNMLLTIIIVFNFYLTGIRVPVHIMKSASGLFDVDKFTPIIQSIVNLIISIILAKYIGLLGILLGTLISSLILPVWQRPYLVYKYVIHKTSKNYFVNNICYILVISVCSLISYIILSKIYISNLLLSFFVRGIFSGGIFIIAVILLYKDKEEFQYLINLITRKYK